MLSGIKDWLIENLAILPGILLIVFVIYLILIKLYNYAIWRNMQRYYNSLLDINNCFLKHRFLKRNRRKTEIKYTIESNEDSVISLPEITNILNIISSHNPIKDLISIHSDIHTICRNYNNFVMLENGFDQAVRMKYDTYKEGHFIIHFIFNSERWRIERFPGGNNVYDDGQVGYKYHEHRLYIGHRLMLCFRLHKYDSASVLEAHMDEATLTDLTRISDLVHYLRKLKEATSTRDAYRRRRHKIALDLQKQNEKLDEHRFRFEIFDSNKSNKSIKK